MKRETAMHQRIDASRTGPATASNGGVAVSGVHHGDINVYSQRPSRSAYRDRVVVTTAPEALLDRQAESEELARFCTRPEGDSYVWWQASPWSGKTALLSWFVLNPPPGTRIVSFFITARLKGHADRSAFLEFVLEQFAEILGEPKPLVSDASGEVAFLDMLARTAQLLAEQGERLVLVIDGLDEDRGVMATPDAYSIAALLPEELSDDVRVIVAGRPNPPVPHDVPASHPLRQPFVVRRLSKSPHATAVEVDMRSEVRRLLLGSAIEKEMLGLITAAGGGLSARDLAELIHEPEFLVEEHLRTVSGRTFTRRPADWRSDFQPEVYLLGHEEIQVEAINRLGSTLIRDYQERIHRWADGYRSRGWPPDTPDYLLRGYHRLVEELDDLPRLLVLGTDSKRHDRMFSITGGDFAGLAEISAVQVMLGAKAPDDLAALGRVTVHRLRVTSRAESIKVNLPHVWARLGQYKRAETLARSMPDPDRRAWALAGVARALAAEGHIDEAMRITSSLAEPRWRAYGLTGIARALAVSGDVARARQVVQEAENLAEGPAASAGVLEVYALCGDNYPPTLRGDELDAHFFAGPLTTAADLPGALDIVASESEPRWRAYALIGIAQAFAAAGNHAQAQTFATRVSAEAESIEDPLIRGFALAPLVAVLHMIGEHRLATRTIELIDEILTGSDRSPFKYHAYAWAELAKAVAATGDTQSAAEFADRAEKASLAEGSMALERAALVQPLVAADEAELALRTAERIAEPSLRAWALCATAEVAPDAVIPIARATADLIKDPGSRFGALCQVADAALRVGDIATATDLRNVLARGAETQGETEGRTSCLASAVAISVRLGDRERAYELAGRISALTDPPVRADAVRSALRALARGGDGDLARDITREWNDVVSEVDDGSVSIDLIAALAPVDREQASEIFERLVNPFLDAFDPTGNSMIPDEDSDLDDVRARLRRDLARLSMADVVETAAIVGDARRALAAAKQIIHALDTYPEEWDDFVRLQLLGTMRGLGESGIASELAASILDEHSRTWAIAETASESVERRAAIHTALKTGSWLPAALVYVITPPELPMNQPVVPARTLSEYAPEALKAIAEELLQV